MKLETKNSIFPVAQRVIYYKSHKKLISTKEGKIIVEELKNIIRNSKQNIEKTLLREDYKPQELYGLQLTSPKKVITYKIEGDKINIRIISENLDKTLGDFNRDIIRKVNKEVISEFRKSITRLPKV